MPVGSGRADGSTSRCRAAAATLPPGQLLEQLPEHVSLPHERPHKLLNGCNTCSQLTSRLAGHLASFLASTAAICLSPGWTWCWTSVVSRMGHAPAYLLAQALLPLLRDL